MAEFGTKRQREDQNTNLTPSERTEGRASQGVDRYQQGRHQQGRNYPSVFSVSPGEFFTMSPITLMRRFTEDIDRAFGFGSGANRGEGLEQGISWVPAVEVRQSGNNLVIHADLPGLNENDIKVEATEDGLAIHGERRQEHTSNEGGWHHSERAYGRFYRLIPLPENAKIEDTKANFRNGVLEVVVPVPELERKNRQIPVGTSSQSLIPESGNFGSGMSSGTSASGSGERSRTAGSGR